MKISQSPESVVTAELTEVVEVADSDSLKRRFIREENLINNLIFKDSCLKVSDKQKYMQVLHADV